MSASPDSLLTNTRFTDSAAAHLRAAIAAAGGIEVFAIGRLNPEGVVRDVEITCRGNDGAVPALLNRPRAGQVVIHNHPSGILKASDADMALASLYGENGVGVVIVDNDVRRALWVVEPYYKPLKPVSEDAVRHFFEERLPKVMPGYEPRAPQVEMALRVSRGLNAGHISIIEAGTGTGKSLAYLVPAVLWALKNDARVAVATFTINLQAQLVQSDIPILEKAGIAFRHATLKGRSNYICRRRMEEEAAREGGEPIVKTIAQWAETAQEGTRGDMAFPVEEESWDLIASDNDQTLRARCPHFNSCFYYQARRRAAAAHVVVVNHHLLLADLSVKKETGGEGILPAFDRLILDEGHHLEDVATSLFRQQLTARGLRRAITPLLTQRKKKQKKARMGALERIAGFHLDEDSPFPRDRRLDGLNLIQAAQSSLTNVYTYANDWMEHIAAAALSPEQRQLRITPKVEQDILWTLQLEPSLQSLRQRLTDAAYHLNRLADLLQELPEPFRLRDPQPLLDLNRALRRITGNATLAAEFLMSEAELVRWIEEARGRNQSPTAALCVAPVEVGPALREQVFDAMTSVITCSATMTVNRGFEHYLSRVGMQPPPERVHTQTFASPFDYRQQALLGLPQDIPDPNDRMFEAVCARFITDALHVSGGGAFVLCTSFALLRGLHRRCQAALGGRFRLLRQGEMSRSRLLNAFRADPDSVLFGTDSFWEGVSVKGNALRLVIIPRLPFRVPTEPVQQARHELLEAQGKDPFKEYSLPQAVLRFRQGFGRLIRTRTDRGAVLVLDRRTTRRWYGRVFLRSLPDLETVRAPGRVVLQRLAGLYHRPAPPAGPPPADGAVRRRVPGSSSSDDLPSGDGSR